MNYNISITETSDLYFGDSYEVAPCKVRCYGREIVIGQGFARVVDLKLDLEYKGKCFDDVCAYVEN